jgi:hypothetical protein
LAQSLVDAWRAAVRAHASAHPLAAEEQALCGAATGEQEMMRLYSTTLVCALLTHRYGLFVQQGDGLCVLMDRAGQYHAPIPDDERCVGNRTTALSDEDAARRMRIVRWDTHTHPCASVVVMTDGLSKAFASSSGVHDVCDWLNSDLVEHRRVTDLSSWAHAHVCRLADAIAGDDVSLAAIVDDELPEGLVSLMGRRHEAFSAQAELEATRQKLVSMQRKHELLERRARGGAGGRDAEYEAYHRRYRDLELRALELERRISACGKARSVDTAARLQST